MPLNLIIASMSHGEHAIHEVPALLSMPSLLLYRESGLPGGGNIQVTMYPAWRDLASARDYSQCAGFYQLQFRPAILKIWGLSSKTVPFLLKKVILSLLLAGC